MSVIFSNLKAGATIRKFYKVGKLCRLASNISDDSSFSPGPETIIDHEFTEDEVGHILDKINNDSPEELLMRAALTPFKVGQIINSRKEKPFESLHQLHNLKFVGNKRILFLGQDILCDKRKKKYKSYKYYIDTKKIKPTFMDSQKPSSVIAICVDTHSFNWMHMDKDYCVHEWAHHKLTGKDRFRFDHETFQHKIWDIIRLFPETGLYLKEEYKPVLRNMMYVPRIISESKIDTMVTSMLNQLNIDDSSSMVQSVYSIKSTALSDHFGLNIAGNRVCSKNLIQDIYHGRHRGINVNMFSEFMSEYMSLERTKQEMMANCLLQCVMFYDLLHQFDTKDDTLKEKAIDEVYETDDEIKKKDDEVNLKYDENNVSEHFYK